MQRPPRPPHEPVLTRARGMLILIHGILIAAAAALGFWLIYRGQEENLGAASTAAFCIVAFSQLLFSFACRSLNHTLPELGLLTNPHLLGAMVVSAGLQVAVVLIPALEPIFAVKAPPGDNWWLIAALSLAPVSIVEISKLVLLAVRSSRSNVNGNRPTT
jgi:P-type Ca2+ transporter type 2C